MAGPHPDPDTSYETLHGSLDVILQETRNKPPHPAAQRMSTTLYQSIKPPHPAAKRLSTALYQPIKPPHPAAQRLSTALYQSIKPPHPAAQQLSTAMELSIKPHHPDSQQLSTALYQVINQSNLIPCCTTAVFATVSINQTSSP